MNPLAILGLIGGLRPFLNDSRSAVSTAANAIMQLCTAIFAGIVAGASAPNRTSEEVGYNAGDGHGYLTSLERSALTLSGEQFLARALAAGYSRARANVMWLKVRPSSPDLPSADELSDVLGNLPGVTPPAGLPESTGLVPPTATRPVALSPYTALDEINSATGGSVGAPGSPASPASRVEQALNGVQGVLGSGTGGSNPLAALRGALAGVPGGSALATTLDQVAGAARTATGAQGAGANPLSALTDALGLTGAGHTSTRNPAVTPGAIPGAGLLDRLSQALPRDLTNLLNTR